MLKTGSKWIQGIDSLGIKSSGMILRSNGLIEV